MVAANRTSIKARQRISCNGLEKDSLMSVNFHPKNNAAEVS